MITSVIHIHITLNSETVIKGANKFEKEKVWNIFYILEIFEIENKIDENWIMNSNRKTNVGCC